MESNQIMELETVTIIKSPNDRRLFKHIILQNELQCILVSDEQSQMSSASLSVNIGSHQDDIQGIAHFLEHMLFMGSKKYPNENDYNTFIKENNGSSNAYTATDHTNYYFDCVPEGLSKVLDIFAQFFIDPLLKTDSVGRELKAVNSEYQNSLTNDGWVMEAVKKQFMINTHPSSKFNMGSLETLDIPNIRESVVEFYNTYYSSHLMKLVVVGTESLEILEKMVVEMFSQVKKCKVSPKINYGKLYNAPIYGKMIPIKDDHELEMNWEYNDGNHSNLNNFMTHIVGHEGTGSLFNVLREKFLAKSLSAGAETDINNNSIFTVSISLTDDGFANINYVKQIVIDYLKMFGKSSYDELLILYNEYKIVRETKFKNYKIPAAEGFTTSISAQWASQNINTNELISHSYIFGDYDNIGHELLMERVKKFVFDTSIIFESSKLFESLDLITEKWYNAKYIKCDILTLDNTDLQLTLPNENVYICKNDKIILCNDANNIPQLLDIYGMELWWKYDISYGTPDVNFKVNVTLPNMNKTIENKVLTSLYFKYLNYVLNAELYNINTANYKASIYKTTSGFTITLLGYPEKFLEVLNFMASKILSFDFDENIFNHIKNILIHDLENYIYTAPYKMIDSELKTHIEFDTYTVESTLNVLKTITYDNLIKFNLFENNTSIYGLIQGNMLRNDAYKCGDILNKFNCNKNTFNFKEQIKTVKTHEFSKIHENKIETNSCYMLSVKIGYLTPEIDEFYLEKYTCLEILNEIIYEQYFDQLRTQEQLGYCVFSKTSLYGNNETQQFTNYNFIVQSSDKDVEYLNTRTKKFVVDFKKFLTEETEENINTLVNSHILLYEKPFQNLDSDFNYNFKIITHHNKNFGLKNDMISCMKLIDKNKLITFYDKYFSLNDNTYFSMEIKKQ